MAFNVRVGALVRPVLLWVLSGLNHRTDCEHVANEFRYLLPLVRGLVCGAKTALGGLGPRVFAADDPPCSTDASTSLRCEFGALRFRASTFLSMTYIH